LLFAQDKFARNVNKMIRMPKDRTAIPNHLSIRSILIPGRRSM